MCLQLDNNVNIHYDDAQIKNAKCKIRTLEEFTKKSEGLIRQADVAQAISNEREAEANYLLAFKFGRHAELELAELSLTPGESSVLPGLARAIELDQKRDAKLEKEEVGKASVAWKKAIAERAKRLDARKRARIVKAAGDLKDESAP